MASAFLDRVSNKALGELLIDKGALSDAQVNEALEISRRKGIRLGEALIFLGYISRDALGYAIGEQYGLRPMELQPSMVEPALIGRFDFDLLSEHTMLPLIELGTELIVVVPDPNEQSGLTALSGLLPDYTITPQLGAADQIRRCLESVKHAGSSSAGNSTPPRGTVATRQIPRFLNVPAPESAEFTEWLIGLAASHPQCDVLIRDQAGDLQVCLAQSAQDPVGKLTESGRWPGYAVADVRNALMRKSKIVEYTREQAALLDYSIAHNGETYDFLIFTPIVHASDLVRIRAMRYCNSLPAREVDATLEAGKYQVLFTGETDKLEETIGALVRELAPDHQIVLVQQFTRCRFPDIPAWPAPFVNVAAAVQATGATCVIYDYPVAYGEIMNLLATASPSPAVAVFAPACQSAGDAASPDLEQLIARQSAQPQQQNNTPNTTDKSRGND